jgi:hypothetical protein
MEKAQLSMEYILILAGAILITIAVGIAIKTALHEETPSIQMSGSKVFSGMIIKAAFDCSQCDNRFVNVIGDIMKGDLNMNWHDILNVNLITGKKLKFDEGDFNKLDANKICLNGKCKSDWKDIGGAYVYYVWWLRPCIDLDANGNCMPQITIKGDRIYTSLCANLKGEGGVIPGKKSNGIYYNCDDVIYGTFLENTKNLSDLDSDGLKEYKLPIDINSLDIDGVIIYTKTNEMVETTDFATDFSTPEEVKNWKCYDYSDYSMKHPGEGSCRGVQILWNKKSMRIIEFKHYPEHSVKICFNLGKKVRILKVVLDYRPCGSWYSLGVGDEKNYITWFADIFDNGSCRWIKNKEVVVNSWYTKYICLWIYDSIDAYSYDISIDNIRLYIAP